MSRSRLIGSVVILAALAVAVWVWAGRQLLEARATAGWPAVAGEVLAAEVRPPRKDGESWRLELRYRYELEGAVYHSDRWDVYGPQRFPTREDAEAALAQHPVGERVDVRYDPAAPSQSVLRTRGTGRAWGMMALGGIVALVAIRLATRLRRSSA